MENSLDHFLKSLKKDLIQIFSIKEVVYFIAKKCAEIISNLKHPDTIRKKAFDVIVFMFKNESGVFCEALEIK